MYLLALLISNSSLLKVDQDVSTLLLRDKRLPPTLPRKSVPFRDFVSRFNDVKSLPPGFLFSDFLSWLGRWLYFSRGKTAHLRTVANLPFVNIPEVSIWI